MWSKGSIDEGEVMHIQKCQFQNGDCLAKAKEFWS